MLLENHRELLALYGGLRLRAASRSSASTRGCAARRSPACSTSRGARVLVVDERLLPEVERVRDAAQARRAARTCSCCASRAGASPGDRRSRASASRARWRSRASRSTRRPWTVTPEKQPDGDLHLGHDRPARRASTTTTSSCCAIGIGVSRNLELGPDDVGYACMPLFHSNAMFLGFQPAFHVGGDASRCASASAPAASCPTCCATASRYWNYVGEPVHYVLAAIEKEYGGDEERILRGGRAATRATGCATRSATAPSPPDIDRFMRWLGLEDMFELYGSTEAAISTFRKKGDPRGSVGEITDPTVKILNERGEECPPARARRRTARSSTTPRRWARSAASRPTPASSRATSTTRTPTRRSTATASTTRATSGTSLERDGQRFLFFDGRTDDWIRKDGENFSAAQVARLLQEHPDVALAAAYGVPCAVSDELVMAALKLRPGARFDPQGFFDFCERQVTRRRHGPQVVPRLRARRRRVRVHADAEDPGAEPEAGPLRPRAACPTRAIYWRRRGDDALPALHARGLRSAARASSPPASGSSCSTR